jgi:hypothetical protein
MRRVLIGVGVLTMAYGVAGAVTDPEVDRLGVLAFLVALLVLHDGVVLPLIIGAGVLIGPAGTRPGLRTAGVITAGVAFVGLPLALGFGRPADNPSALPQAYGRNLLLILIVIWAAAGIGKGLERRRRQPPGPRSG